MSDVEALRAEVDEYAMGMRQTPQTTSALTVYVIKHGGLYVRDDSASNPTRIYGLTGYFVDVAIFMYPPSLQTMNEVKACVGLPDITSLTVVEWAITETDFNWQDPGASDSR